jgi:hypothetical protein
MYDSRFVQSLLPSTGPWSEPWDICEPKRMLGLQVQAVGAWVDGSLLGLSTRLTLPSAPGAVSARVLAFALPSSLSPPLSLSLVRFPLSLARALSLPSSSSSSPLNL